MQSKFPIELLWVIIAIFGGVARYLDRYLRNEEQFSYKRIIANFFVTGFTGWMAAIITLSFYPNWAVVAAGIGGYAGTQIMDEIIKIIKLRLNMNEQERKNDKSIP